MCRSCRLVRCLRLLLRKAVDMRTGLEDWNLSLVAKRSSEHYKESMALEGLAMTANGIDYTLPPKRGRGELMDDEEVRSGSQQPSTHV